MLPTNPSQIVSDNNNEILNLTSEIVAAHVANNEVKTEDLSDIIREVYGTLQSLNSNMAMRRSNLVPAIAIEDSVREDHIVCLEDGRKLKMLKRHLKSSYNMTPDEYRERWGLPNDYPMVAPNYAKRRSALAMEIGLGRKRKAA